MTFLRVLYSPALFSMPYPYYYMYMYMHDNINDLYHIRDRIRTDFMVYEHNQARIRILFAFQARDSPHTFNAMYRGVQYSLLFFITVIKFT